MTRHVNFNSIVLFILIALGGFIHCSSARGQEATHYAIIDLGNIGGSFAATPRGINNSGVVVGDTLDTSMGRVRAFVWREGTVSFLDPLTQDFSATAYRINELGEVAGVSYIAFGVQHAVKWLADGTLVDLGTLDGEDSAAYGISASGQVVGAADLQEAGRRACLLEDGQILDLGDLGRPSSSANAINSSRQIVGSSGRTEPGSRAILWENGEMINLGTLPNGTQSIATDINDAGVIAGEATASNGARNAVLWENGVIRSIHSPTLGSRTGAYAINESGQVVGYIDVDETVENLPSFFYEDPGPMVDIRTILPPHHTWRKIGTTLDINDHGEIVGIGDRIGGSRFLYHAVLITPVHPTLTLQGPQPGNAGTPNGMRITGCTPGARVHFPYSRHGGGARASPAATSSRTRFNSTARRSSAPRSPTPTASPPSPAPSRPSRKARPSSSRPSSRTSAPSANSWCIGSSEFFTTKSQRHEARHREIKA